MYDIEYAKERLANMEELRDRIRDELVGLEKLGIRNRNILAAFVNLSNTLTSHIHDLSHSIQRKEKRANHQSISAKRAAKAQEQIKVSGFAGMPAEEGSLSSGLRGQPEETELGQP